MQEASNWEVMHDLINASVVFTFWGWYSTEIFFCGFPKFADVLLWVGFANEVFNVPWT